MRAWIIGVLLSASVAMGAGEFSATVNGDLTTVGGGITYEGFSLGIETLLVRDHSSKSSLAGDTFLGGYFTVPVASLENTPLIKLPIGSRLSGKAGGYWEYGENSDMVRMYGGIIDIPIRANTSFRVQVMQVNGSSKIDDTLATVGLAFGF